jgi:hypothetical protein
MGHGMGARLNHDSIAAISHLHQSNRTQWCSDCEVGGERPAALRRLQTFTANSSAPQCNQAPRIANVAKYALRDELLICDESVQRHNQAESQSSLSHYGLLVERE